MAGATLLSPVVDRLSGSDGYDEHDSTAEVEREKDAMTSGAQRPEFEPVERPSVMKRICRELRDPCRDGPDSLPVQLAETPYRFVRPLDFEGHGRRPRVSGAKPSPDLGVRDGTALPHVLETLADALHELRVAKDLHGLLQGFVLFLGDPHRLLHAPSHGPDVQGTSQYMYSSTSCD